MFLTNFFSPFLQCYRAGIVADEGANEYRVLTPLPSRHALVPADNESGYSKRPGTLNRFLNIKIIVSNFKKFRYNEHPRTRKFDLKSFKVSSHQVSTCFIQWLVTTIL